MTVPRIHVNTNVTTIDEARRAITDLARCAKAMDYEQAERDTGKVWEDGKRIYRLVYKSSNPPTTDKSYSLTGSGFSQSYADTIVSLAGMIIDTAASGSQVPIPWYNGTIYISCRFRDGATPDIFVETNDDWTASPTYDEIHFIIEYTKN